MFQGERGFTGEDGRKGDTGDRGFTGEDGIGIKGDKGMIGDEGPKVSKFIYKCHGMLKTWVLGRCRNTWTKGNDCKYSLIRLQITGILDVIQGNKGNQGLCGKPGPAGAPVSIYRIMKTQERQIVLQK